ncbi:hypothetical protein [Robertmurraya kyonggiensis]|uniref:Uncharacterized protein n=1 Tax=Robertmurraya kyonggiensis TaxID=1037680 RepID=A0A4U1D1D4_9BACI|nr:hypothetical protein [Robertmurraya kyonggiensis]TKC14957.1 hypothetical protein FA727_20860 [Robertmurraya kyonggiensis]
MESNFFDEKAPIMKVEDQDRSTQLQLELLEHTGESPANIEGKVEGETITYKEVYSNIDLKYTVGSDRIKEDIIYTEKPEEGFPSRFSYKMNLEGLKVKEEAGTIYLYDSKTNERLYYFEALYV